LAGGLGVNNEILLLLFKLTLYCRW